MSYLMGGNPRTVEKSVFNKLAFARSRKEGATNTEKLSSQFRFKLSAKSKAKLELLSKASNKSQGAIVREGIEAFSSALAGKNEVIIGGKIYKRAKSLRAKRVR